MALYFGNNKVNVNLGGEKYHLNLIVADIESIIGLTSADNYILKDLNGSYLISRKKEKGADK